MLFLYACIVYIFTVWFSSSGYDIGYFWIIPTLMGIFLFKKESHTVLYFWICLSLIIFVWSYLGNNRHEEQLDERANIVNITGNYTKKVSIVWSIDKALYTSDHTSTYRLYIDKIDTHSTQKWQKFWYLFVEIPKNLDITKWDILSFSEKVYPVWDFPLSWFERYAWKNRIFWKIYLNNFEKVLNWKQVWVFTKIQDWSVNTLMRGFPREVASTVLWMTVWNTDLQRSWTKHIFIQSWISHILVVSGSNIAFVILFILFFLKYIPIWISTRMYIVVGFVFMYGTLVGWDTPVIRAALMWSIGYIWLRYSRKISSMSILLCIGCILITFDPFLLLYDAGFWLSFWATFWILMFYDTIDAFFRKNLGLTYISWFFAITLSALGWSLPIMIYHFWYISIASILTNILIAPLLGWILFTAVIYLLLAALSITHLYFVWLVVYFPTYWILEIARFFSTGIQIEIPESYRWLMSLMILGCLLYIFMEREITSLRLRNQTNS